jgi:hypothetical protein
MRAGEGAKHLHFNDGYISLDTIPIFATDGMQLIHRGGGPALGAQGYNQANCFVFG